MFGLLCPPAEGPKLTPWKSQCRVSYPIWGHAELGYVSLVEISVTALEKPNQEATFGNSETLRPAQEEKGLHNPSLKAGDGNCHFNTLAEENMRVD